MEKILTAEEYIPDNNYYFVETIRGNTETAILKEDVVEIMKEFAKLHVEAALRRAYKNQGMSWTNSNNEETKIGLFMRNSYSLENIK